MDQNPHALRNCSPDTTAEKVGERLTIAELAARTANRPSNRQNETGLTISQRLAARQHIPS